MSRVWSCPTCGGSRKRESALVGHAFLLRDQVTSIVVFGPVPNGCHGFDWQGDLGVGPVRFSDVEMLSLRFEVVEASSSINIFQHFSLSGLGRVSSPYLHSISTIAVLENRHQVRSEIRHPPRRRKMLSFLSTVAWNVFNMPKTQHTMSTQHCTAASNKLLTYVSIFERASRSVL